MTQQGKSNSHSEPNSPDTAQADGMNEGITVLAYLISGVAVYGAVGWLGDHFLKTSFLLPIGIVLGAAVGIYVIIRRFGRISGATPAAGSTAARGHATAEPKDQIDE